MGPLQYCFHSYWNFAWENPPDFVMRYTARNTTYGLQIIIDQDKKMPPSQPSQSNQYQRVLIQFMSYKDATQYEEDHTFTANL